MCCVSIVKGSITEPFSIVDHGNKWRSVSMHRSVPPNLTLDQVFQRDGGIERIVVLSSSASSDDFGSLSQFAAQVKGAVAVSSSSNILDLEVTRMGHAWPGTSFLSKKPDWIVRLSTLRVC